MGRQPHKMVGRVALVTGANRGIGLEIVRQLSAKGYFCYLGCRDLSQGKHVALPLGDGVAAIELDVTNYDDHERVFQVIQARWGHLDALVNNAGILQKDNSPAAFRQTYEANTIAPYFLALKLLPLLQASPAGRIVNQSSILGSLSGTAEHPPGADWALPAYNSSKAALNMLTILLAQQVEGTHIKVNAAHPGWVKTDMGGPNAMLDLSEGAETAVWLATLDANGPTGGFFHRQERLPW